MKELNPVCYLSAILYIYAKPGLKCSRFNIFASFAKHGCKPKHRHLKIVTMAFPRCKHGIYEA